MKRIEDLLNLDLPLPAQFFAPSFPKPVQFDPVDADFGDEDEEVEVDEDESESVEKPGTIHFGGPAEPTEAENLGDDFFGESAGSTRATGRKKFDEDEEGAEEENPDLDELDTGTEEEADATEEADSDLDDDDEFDDDDDDLDDDDDEEFDDDE